ncbi:hypothetical protein [Bifidobacterium moukalabense]|uniref:hypothetical protein n=1 Tax=Bifidobacterium moukalabense TaxID=1333651 RepID=UPI0010F44E47|nr:hypothetical protein [Bifidobacterium moukalabense]
MESKASPTDLKREKNHHAATAGGRAAGAYKNVNNLYNQERFHAAQGHGFAAEQANDLADQLHGKKVHKGLGDDNAKDGPDRMVNGQWIQAKYYKDGARAIDACFRDNGKGALRYYDQNNEPMRIEVPNDDVIYNKAVERMEAKIKNGQVEGVTDPAKAKEIVQRGGCTYRQARNIAKAGNIDSLKFDATNGAVVAASAFGVSAIVTFATGIWNGDTPQVAAKRAACCGIKVGGTSFVVAVLSSQLLKAGLNSAMVAGTESIAAVLGPRACAIIINAFRSGAPIYGAAAMKSAAKLFRGNAVVAALTVVVCSSFDVADIVRGRISAGQLVKNLASTITTVGAGSAGWVGGAALGTMIMPGVGSIVGGLIGSMSGGVAAGALTNKVVGHFIKDDAEEMQHIIQKQVEAMCVDNLMNNDEVKELVNGLSGKLSGSKLKDMYVSKDRERFVEKMAAPLLDEILAKRPKIKGNIDDEIEQGLISLLNELAEKGESVEDTGASEEDC